MDVAVLLEINQSVQLVSRGKAFESSFLMLPRSWFQFTSDPNVQIARAVGHDVNEVSLRVSLAYAADIRTGRRRPHPRHWLTIAQLVGFQLPWQAGGPDKTLGCPTQAQLVWEFCR